MPVLGVSGTAMRPSVKAEQQATKFAALKASSNEGSLKDAVVADIEHHCFEDNHLRALLEALVAEGVLRDLALEPGHFYAAAEGEEWHGYYLVAERI